MIGTTLCWLLMQWISYGQWGLSPYELERNIHINVHVHVHDWRGWTTRSEFHLWYASIFCFGQFWCFTWCSGFLEMQKVTFCFYLVLQLIVFVCFPVSVLLWVVDFSALLFWLIVLGFCSLMELVQKFCITEYAILKHKLWN